MTSRSRLVALLIAAITAATPAAAYGQGAGDDQYQDPFGDEVPQEQGTPEGEGGTQTSQDEPEATPTPESGEPLSSSPPGGMGDDEEEEAPAATPAQAEPAPTELPNTGADAGLIGLAGLGMVLCGTGLRLRLRPHGERA